MRFHSIRLDVERKEKCIGRSISVGKKWITLDALSYFLTIIEIWINRSDPWRMTNHFFFCLLLRSAQFDSPETFPFFSAFLRSSYLAEWAKSCPSWLQRHLLASFQCAASRVNSMISLKKKHELNLVLRVLRQADFYFPRILLITPTPSVGKSWTIEIFNKRVDRLF